MKKKFYEYTQNNSGGSFVTDDKLCHRLFIEENNSEKANEIAENLGVYFNGCEDGLDCYCCGDRWSQPDEIEIPYRYGCFSLKEAKKFSKKYNIKYDKTEFRFMGIKEPNPDDYDIIFDTIEKYAKYLCDEYGNDGIDGRIYYKNGKVLEIK